MRFVQKNLKINPIEEFEIHKSDKKIVNKKNCEIVLSDDRIFRNDLNIKNIYLKDLDINPISNGSFVKYIESVYIYLTFVIVTNEKVYYNLLLGFNISFTDKLLYDDYIDYFGKVYNVIWAVVKKNIKSGMLKNAIKMAGLVVNEIFE